ncbi:MAG: alpha-1,2-fucosyltransferase [Bacteroidetes bacterium]|nr:alpha-1,2-fucosyltransferase [Bacteroidota bacterium]
MIAVRLSDGLGNQLFQIAFGYSLSIKFSKEFYLTGDVHSIFSNNGDNSFISRSFRILNLNEIDKFKRNDCFFNFKKLKFNKYQTFQELNFKYSKPNINLLHPTLFKGFWQSEKYFIEFNNQIRLLFSGTPILDFISTSYLNQIILCNSVAIHVRRGDYISVPENFEKHGFCDVDYYKRAINYLLSKEQDLSFFIFTDDIEWVRINMLPLFVNIIIVSTNNVGVDSWRDLYLMTQCKHQIIANSTFSWWGAWLNSNQHKQIIAPKNWFSNKELNDSTGDLIPETWIRL